MGYNLYITRAEFWLGNEGKEISEAQWRTVVESDSELELRGFAEAISPQGEVIRYDSPLLAVWSGHSRIRGVGFDLRRGNVVVKNPDKETLTKMHQLARQLDATIQGEEGEVYEGAGQ